MIFPRQNDRTPYGAVVSQRLGSLEHEVCEAIEVGYVPLGGVFQQHIDNIPYWHQMMWRPDAKK